MEFGAAAACGREGGREREEKWMVGNGRRKKR